MMIKTMKKSITEAQKKQVVLFWEIFEPLFEWTLLPNQFLYDAYEKWYQDIKPDSPKIDKINFRKQLVIEATQSDDWVDRSYKQTSIKPSDKMNGTDPVAITLDLKKWIRPFEQNKIYRGIVRKEALNERKRHAIQQ